MKKATINRLRVRSSREWNRVDENFFPYRIPLLFLGATRGNIRRLTCKRKKRDIE